jgi:hypothetical protein
MRSSDDIKKQLKHTRIRTNPEVDEAVLNDLYGRLDGTEGVRENTWTVIVHHKMTKFAVAAVIVVAVLFGISHFGGSIDGASVAWAEVVRHIEQVDHLHFYYIETEQNGYSSIREGWYAHGKIKTRQYDAEQTIDNGAVWMVLDEHNNIIKKGKSTLAEFDNIFDGLSKDILSYRFSQFENKTPVSIGSDFLIYEFEPHGDKAEWIDKITVTVGRNSLMPVQIKTYFKKGKWSMNHLLVFDYEAAEKPEAFFALPTQAKSPHGIGRLVPDGEEIEIELHNAPGIKKAIARLHTKFEGSDEGLLKSYRQKYERFGEPMYFMEATFVTDENYQSDTSKNFPLWLDQGVKAAMGIKETKSDNKYRYIIYTPVLRATDKENVFNLELSCWMKSKQIDL